MNLILCDECLPAVQTLADWEGSCSNALGLSKFWALCNAHVEQCLVELLRSPEAKLRFEVRPVTHPHAPDLFLGTVQSGNRPEDLVSAADLLRDTYRPPGDGT